jgi:hypothetical protein
MRYAFGTPSLLLRRTRWRHLWFRHYLEGVDFYFCVRRFLEICLCRRGRWEDGKTFVRGLEFHNDALDVSVKGSPRCWWYPCVFMFGIWFIGTINYSLSWNFFSCAFPCGHFYVERGITVWPHVASLCSSSRWHLFNQVKPVSIFFSHKILDIFSNFFSWI